MKKYLVIIIIIALAVAIFLLFRKCESQKATTPIDVSLYKDPFIYANTEFTCKISKNPSIAENKQIMKKNLNESYKKYGFPVEDNETMLKILNFYENDKEVIDEIRKGVNECEQS